jgi:hypothetical protein
VTMDLKVCEGRKEVSSAVDWLWLVTSRLVKSAKQMTHGLLSTMTSILIPFGVYFVLLWMLLWSRVLTRCYMRELYFFYFTLVMMAVLILNLIFTCLFNHKQSDTFPFWFLGAFAEFLASCLRPPGLWYVLWHRRIAK